MMSSPKSLVESIEFGAEPPGNEEGFLDTASWDCRLHRGHDFDCGILK
jgi:hypothetical protein